MIEIIRYLLRRKVRTALTVLAVAVGIFAVTTVGSISESLEALVQSSEAEAMDRVFVQPENWDRPVTEATLREIRRVEGVAGVAVTMYDSYLEEQEEQVVTILINPEGFMGTRSDIPGLEFEPPSAGVELYAGRLPSPNSRAETVVTWKLAQERGLEVGDILMIRGRPFRVVGIWGPQPDASTSMAYVSYDVAEEMSSYASSLGVGLVYAFPQPGVDIEQLAERIEREVSGVQAQSPHETLQQVRLQMLIFSLIVGASGIMALLIGSFTVVNSMIVSVHERRREIGLKKALGAADTHILAETVAEAAFIGGMGGLVGVLVGFGVTAYANQALFDLMGLRLFLITPRLAIGAVVFTVLMGIVAGLYPAWQAARLDPVVTLRGGSGVHYVRNIILRLFDRIRRSTRAILTVGGIAIGVFSLVVLGSLSEYLNGFLDDGLAGSRGKVAIEAQEGVPFGTSIARVVRRIPGVREVIVAGNGGSIEREDTQGIGGRFFGIDSPTGEYGLEMPMKVEFAQGRNLTPGSLDEVVVGADLAEKHDLRVGDTFTIRERDFTVVGIWKRIPRDISGFNSLAYISLEALALVLKESSPISHMTAIVEPGADVNEVAEAIETELPGVVTTTASEIDEQIRPVFNILIGIMAGLFSIAVFVGSVSVVNTMIIAVHERTREIGLKKALGAADTDILAEVLAYAGKLGGVGGILGVVAAWPVVVAINFYAQTAGGFTILDLTPRLAVGAVVFSVLLGVISGLVPAWRAARLDPVVALRTE
ncbi:MAG: ABC transporter permease [Anaerolineae bacterium]|nr:ABC transporter permease [Anaerolineae bacterium]